MQQKLRREVQASLNGDAHMDYETLHRLPLLDAIVKETLRMVRNYFIYRTNHSLSSSAVLPNLICQSYYLENRKRSSCGAIRNKHRNDKSRYNTGGHSNQFGHRRG